MTSGFTQPTSEPKPETTAETTTLIQTEKDSDLFDLLSDVAFDQGPSIVFAPPSDVSHTEVLYTGIRPL
jgi:hypothetical protein